MKEFTYKIKDILGVHARPAQKLINLVNKFDSDVKIVFDGKEVNIKDLDEFVEMGIKHKDEIRVIVEGEDENILSRALEVGFSEYL